MKRRHALLIGFGLGGLVVITLVVVAGGMVPHLQARPVAGSTDASPSPTGSPAASPSPAPLPGARAGAVMVYDPENHGLILFGGVTAAHQPDGSNRAVTLGETWLWNGTSWRRLDVEGPPARGSAMAVYDSVRHVVLLFGGSGPGGAGPGLYFQDTWTWDGARWQLQNPAHSPNPRMRAGMAFDRARGVAVMFGGEGATTYTATWTWDGADWTLRDPATTPTPRMFPGMAYDDSRGVTVMYGGSWMGQHLTDTWIWDGTNWTQSGAGPNGGWSRLTYDSIRHLVVAYIYTPAAPYVLTWDGARWTDRTAAQPPPSQRAEASLAFDEETHQVVLYGGAYQDPAPYGETWTWDGSKWSLWEAPGAA